MATIMGACRGSAAQKKQQQKKGDDVKERVTKLETSIASICSNNNIKRLVKSCWNRKF
jgi:hypothetical protein